MSGKSGEGLPRCRWGRQHTWSPSVVEGGVTVERRCTRCGQYKHLAITDPQAEAPRAGDPILSWRPGRRP